MTDRFDEKARKTTGPYARCEKPLLLYTRAYGQSLNAELNDDFAQSLRDTWNEAIEAALDASTESFATSNAIQALKVK